MMQTIAASGAGFSGASAVHMNIFGLNPVVVYGSDEQKRRMLPPIVAGKEKACFAVTEPNAGLETAKLQTRAERRGDRYVITGAKIWITTAQVADRMLILTRSAPIESGRRPTDGLTLVLHRARPPLRRGARDREDGTEGGRFQSGVHRRVGSAGRGPHRRGRPRL